MAIIEEVSDEETETFNQAYTAIQNLKLNDTSKQNSTTTNTSRAPRESLGPISIQQLLTHLQTPSRNELSTVKALRTRASEIISDSQSNETPAEDTITLVLTEVVKPLFSSSTPNSAITNTGRPNAYATNLPQSALRFIDDPIHDIPTWKTNWSVPLLGYLLDLLAALPDSSRRKCLERNFYFFVPALLKLIDDIDLALKSDGCDLLRRLCEIVKGGGSQVMKSSGLTPIFVDALKAAFSYLPTLTPAHESLELYTALYPAYLSLIQARFQPSTLDPVQKEPKEEIQRQGYLTLLIRHQTFYGIQHLDTRTSGSTAPELSTFFIAQIPSIVKQMGIASCVHLPQIIPLCSGVLGDQFAVSSLLGLSMVDAVLNVLEAVMEVCKVRIKEWWTDILGGLVECWLNMVDALKDRMEREVEARSREIQERLKEVVMVLQSMVGKELEEWKGGLIEEEPNIKGLFNS